MLKKIIEIDINTEYFLSRYRTVATIMHRLVIWFTFVLIAVADVSHLYNVGNERSEVFHPALQNSGRFLPQLNPELDYSLPEHRYRDVLASKNIQILHQNHDAGVGGNYYWSYSTANGIAAEEIATIEAMDANNVAKSVRGSYQYISPEGIPIFVSYTADENGFQPHINNNNGQIYSGRGPQEHYRSIASKEY